MADSELFTSVAGLMVDTARAHHAATGGINAQWAQWYAERMVGDLNELTGTGLEADELAAWLTEADQRYRSEDQPRSWPKMYATWLLNPDG